MSYQVPQDYPTLPSMAIPHALVGDDIKQFKGARVITKYLPSASGSTVGPSSSVLFTIPAEPYGYIKPNSMYLRGRVVLAAQTGAVGTAVAGGPTNSCFAFAGNTYLSNAATPTLPNSVDRVSSPEWGVGGASSLLNRVTLTLPGGCSMSYNQQNHYRNAVTPHTMDASYLSDLRQSEHAGVTHVVQKIPLDAGVALVLTNVDVVDKWFSFPMDIPLLNADSAFPLLLCSQGLSLELVTSSLAESVYYPVGADGTDARKSAATAPTTYRLSELTLVYDVIMVTPEFKTALVASKAGNPYVVHVDDRMVIGPIGCTNASSTRVNVGVGLSSLKSVLFTEGNNGVLSAPKVYSSNLLTSYNVYRDGQQISIPNTTSEDVAFMEMQRAIGRLNDPQTTSMLFTDMDPYTTSTYAAPTVVNVVNKRTSYPDGGFLAGCSMQCIDDWSFSAKGVACDQLAIELIKTGGATSDSIKWGTTNAGFANSSLYIFCMYDSVCVILGDGTCQIRK
jgi:hypothetical protein